MHSFEASVPNTNTGHGHVWARPDGVKARCGGPGMCKQCAFEAGRMRAVSDDAMRLRRIERDMKLLQDDVREQASGEQDGYLLGIADRIRAIMA